MKTYYANDGRSDTYDPSAGESQIDLGGFIPWSRYSNSTPGLGHWYARAYDNLGSWPPGYPTTFRELVEKYGFDLHELDARIDATLGSAAGVLPFNPSQLVIDPDLIAYNASGAPPLPFPIERDAWWSCTPSGAPGSGKRKVLMWPYKLNGGPVMVCMASDGNGNIARPAGNPTADVVVFNQWFHWRHLGTNKNRWRDVDGWTQEFSGPASGTFMEYFGGRMSSGLEILGMHCQAIEAGDIVVFSGENIANNLWITMQRSLDAEALVRTLWTVGPPRLNGPSFPPVPVGKVYTDGSSWGQLAGGTMNFLDPATFSGTAAWNISDFGYAQTEYYDLQYDLSAMIGHAGWLPSTDPIWTSQFLAVDVLQVRFDRPLVPGRGWDVAAFSMNRRPLDLHVPVLGRLGDNEYNYPSHWPSDDATGLTFGTGASFQPKFLKNWEHYPVSGFVPGYNEFAAWDNGEWSALKASGVARLADNPQFPPTGTAPTKPYPDPYTHTLRHVHSDPSPNAAVLSQMDLQNGMVPNYRSPAGLANGTNKTMGHGTWLGFKDNMHVLDLDGDGYLEVVFGNFEGYVHILEFQPGGSAVYGTGTGGYPADGVDPYRLYDEWKSPYLGRGIIGADCIIVNGKAQLFFGTSNGEVFRIDATTANTYAVANNGLPIVSAMGGSSGPQTPYPGPTPLLLVNDFARGTGNKELLVVNRMLDWTLYDTNGIPIQTTPSPTSFRSNHVVGPTDAFPVFDPDSASDANRELLVSASDGHVWWLDWLSGTTTSNWGVEASPALPYTGLSLFKVVPFTVGSGTLSTHALLFGRNDDRDDDANFDGLPDGKPDAIQLWNLTNSQLLADVPPGFSVNFDNLDSSMSFAWLQKPNGAGIGQFVIGTGRTIQTYSVDAAGVIGYQAGVEVFQHVSPAQKYTQCITSVDVASLKPSSSGSPQKMIIFCDCSGRIYVMNPQLQFQRMSNHDLSGVTIPAPPPGKSRGNAARASNRTLAGNFAFCAEDASPKDGSGRVFFADYAAPAQLDTDTTPPPPPAPAGTTSVYPVGAIEVGISGANAFDLGPDVFGSTNTMIEAHNETPWDDSRPNHNRSLVFRDLDAGKSGGDPERELEIFAETGIVYYDDDYSQLRRFQTAAFDPKFLNNARAHASLEGFFGGHVFEHPLRYPASGSKKAYNYLGGFTIPLDGFHHNYRGSAGNGWWYPTIGASFLSGQIESHWQSIYPPSMGTSMKLGRLLVGEGANAIVKSHVVVGTNGGFVYAIKPGTPLTPPTYGEVPSTLTYSSRDLGSFVVGLDCGNLDSDPEDEIVCGTWIDDGSFVDWQNGATHKNRGKLYLLDPTPTAGSPAELELTGDADFLAPNAGKGIGASVFGVKIDDVNGDGDQEIWCVDQFHVYLFYKRTSDGLWHIATRSADLGCFPGFYNNLFPIKKKVDEAGQIVQTVKLVVATPGYLIEFSVDPAMVPN